MLLWRLLLSQTADLMPPMAGTKTADKSPFCIEALLARGPESPRAQAPAQQGPQGSLLPLAALPVFSTTPHPLYAQYHHPHHAVGPAGHFPAVMASAFHPPLAEQKAAGHLEWLARTGILYPRPGDPTGKSEFSFLLIMFKSAISNFTGTKFLRWE